MEFKKRYRFMSFGPIFWFLFVFDIGIICSIICMLVFGLPQFETNGLIPALVFIGIAALCMFWFTMELGIYVSIDKDKVELKSFKGTLIRYNIDDITKVQIKSAFKRDTLWIEMLGEKPQIQRKSLVVRNTAITVLFAKRTMKVLRHFITNEELFKDIKTIYEQ